MMAEAKNNFQKELAVSPELPLLIERLARGLDEYRDHTVGIQSKLRSIGQEQGIPMNPTQEVKSPECALEHLFNLCVKLEDRNSDILLCYRQLERII